MHPPETRSDVRLNSIDTLWTAVRQAHQGGNDAANARQRLLDRYGGAIRRYLVAATRDAEGAEDLFQDFAVVFLGGGLRAADPGRGRFRDYVKGVLFRLVADFHSGPRRRPLPLGPGMPEPAVDPDAEREQQFLASWRDELLARAWEGLRQAESASGQFHFTVLRFRAEHAGASSQEMAEALGKALGKPLTAAGVRQTLHRAREHFADLLLDELAQALAEPTEADLEEELTELGLLEHCRPALERRRGAT